MQFGRKIALALVGASTLMVAGCATETTYRPATGSGFYRTGYSDQQLEPGRFIVSFAGNTVTSRDTVERYLLFRAAELTLANGYDYFVMADRDTQLRSRTYSTPGLRAWLRWMGRRVVGSVVALLRPRLRLAQLGPVLG